MKKFLLTVLMLYSFSSFSSTFYNCDVFNGHVSYCGSWSQTESNAVLQSDGSYRDCSIFNGRVSSCKGWFHGKAIIEKQ